MKSMKQDAGNSLDLGLCFHLPISRPLLQGGMDSPAVRGKAGGIDQNTNTDCAADRFRGTGHL